jgi:hypothetical protein
MRDKQSHFAYRQFVKPCKDFELGASVKRGSGLVKYEHLRLAQIGARKREFLPFAAGEVDAAFKAPAEHLIIFLRKPLNDAVGETLFGGSFNTGQVGQKLDAAHRYVLTRGHLIAHEILEDDADFAAQVVDVVLAQIDAIEQNLPGGWIVEPGDELDDSGFALAILSNKGDTFTGLEAEIQMVEDEPLGSRIGEGDVAEFEALPDGSRSGKGMGLGLNGGPKRSARCCWRHC